MELVLISTKDSTVRVLKKIESGPYVLTRASFSPDGRRVVRRHRMVALDRFSQVQDNEIIYDVTHPDGRRERLVQSLSVQGYPLVQVALSFVGAWTFFTAPLTELRATIEYEQRRQAELEMRIGTLSAERASAEASGAAAAAQADAAKIAAAAAAKAASTSAPSTTGSTKSFSTYAYIKKMTGPYNETFTVYLDTVQILTGAKATAYAKAHHTKVPSNGILYVNSDSKLTSYPLADTATITAYTGGVENMTPMPIEAGKLQQWVADPTVIPDASSNMWQVVVTKGVITSIKMIAVAG